MDSESFVECSQEPPKKKFRQSKLSVFFTRDQRNRCVCRVDPVAGASSSDPLTFGARAGRNNVPGGFESTTEDDQRRCSSEQLVETAEEREDCRRGGAEVYVDVEASTTSPTVNIDGLSDSDVEANDSMDPDMRAKPAAAALRRMGQHRLSPSSSDGSRDDVISSGRESRSPAPPDEESSSPSGREDSVEGKEEPRETTRPSWRGCPLDEILRAPPAPFDAPALHRNGDDQHVILVRVPIRPEDGIPAPYPETYRDAWDSSHVHMPCSPYNVSPENSSSRWELIQSALTRTIRCVDDLREAVSRYNRRAVTGPKAFLGLKEYVEKVLEPEERIAFLEETLPAIVQLAMKLPEVVTQPPPLLKRGKTKSLSLSQCQIACLLANAFLCTFPRRNLNRMSEPGHQYSNYPDINFNRLFAPAENPKRRNGKWHKLRSILHYFECVAKDPPTGIVTLTRKCFGELLLPDWSASAVGLASKVHICSEGLIEVHGEGMLQLDFANKFIGGGVMGCGLVQEEIRFILWPELFVTRLLTECLADNEVLLVSGVEQFNCGVGYSDNFEWTGGFHDPHPPSDRYRRKMTQILAIDAVHFANPHLQFLPKFILRELNKAFAGFLTEASEGRRVGIATGNWGCGAFMGDPRLKFLLQLMAVSEVRRDGMAYFTFRDARLRDELHGMHNFLLEKSATVGQLFNALKKFGRKDVKGTRLFSFLRQEIDALDEKTARRMEDVASKRGDAKTGTAARKPPKEETRLASMVGSPSRTSVVAQLVRPSIVAEEEDKIVLPSDEESETFSSKNGERREKFSAGDGLWSMLEGEEEKNPVLFCAKSPK